MENDRSKYLENDSLFFVLTYSIFKENFTAMISEDEKHNQVNDNLQQYGKPTSFDEVWRLFQETDKQFKETDKKIKEAFDLFTCQWGRLIESLVDGDLPRILQERGILVSRTIQRVEGGAPGKKYEFDIIAVDGDVSVVVEVKTTLRPQDVTRFLYKMQHFREWMPEFSKKETLGAVAYLQSSAGSESMAQNKGLFTIRATGSSAYLTNAGNFKPKCF